MNYKQASNIQDIVGEDKQIITQLINQKINLGKIQAGPQVVAAISRADWPMLTTINLSRTISKVLKLCLKQIGFIQQLSTFVERQQKFKATYVIRCRSSIQSELASSNHYQPKYNINKAILIYVIKLPLLCQRRTGLDQQQSTSVKRQQGNKKLGSSGVEACLKLTGLFSLISISEIDDSLLICIQAKGRALASGTIGSSKATGSSMITGNKDNRRVVMGLLIKKASFNLKELGIQYSFLLSIFSLSSVIQLAGFLIVMK